MSPHHTPTPSKQSIPGRARRSTAIAATAFALAVGATSIAAAPAQAASSGVAPPCAVSAERPYHNGEFTVSGKKQIVYPIKVSCWETGVKVHLSQKLMESDEWPNGDDVQRGWRNAGTVSSTVGTQTVNTVYRLANMDDVGKSEVYHMVKFRVVDRHGNSSKEITVSSAERSIRP
jgi:hypothetical protein